MSSIQGPPQGRLRRAPRLRQWIIGFLLSFLVVVALPWVPEAPASLEDDVRFVGRLALPKTWDRDDNPVILAMEPKSRRIISVYRNKATARDSLLIYDLKPRLPKIARDVSLGADFLRNQPSPYLNVVDTKRDRLLSLLSPSLLGSVIQVLNLKTASIDASWDLTRVVPAFVGWGVTYSEKDDLVYVVGETTAAYSAQNGFFFPAGSKPPLSAVLIALRPSDGTAAWILGLPHCQPLNTRAVGSLIARSALYDALYVPCARSLAYPNLAGIERIWINPRAGQAEAINFRQEFFPISGVWINNGAMVGIAAFDAVTDRVLLQSLSLATPGAWVFDGRISGWVGFIPTPLPSDSVGLNQGTGHFYATKLNQPMLISSARGTPVPQGTIYSNARTGADAVFVYTDAASNRFFISVGDPQDESILVYGVFEDRTVDESPLRDPDYDALTSDVEEDPSAIATFAGGVRGFGSRLSMVGGGGGAWEGIRQFFGGTQLPSWPVPVSPGDRAVILGSVPSIDLRNAGAASSAQAVAPDTNTDEEIRTKQTQVRDTNPALAPAAPFVAWPWAPVVCLDGGGDSIEQESNAAGGQGEARIVCDLQATSSIGYAKSPGLAYETPQLTIRLGASSSDARAVNSTQGMVTAITSVLDGLWISAPGVGSLSIGRASSTARAVAHGRPGTARVSLERTLERIVVRDGDGDVVRSINECDLETEACMSVLAAVNALVAPRLRLYVPAATLRNTPKGAFAGAQKADAEYLNALNTQNDNSRVVPAIELIAYNDTAEKSRLVIQAAGVQVNSIYYLQAAATGERDTEIIKEIIQVPVDRIITQEVPGPPQVITRIGRRPSGLPARLSGALAVMARSPKEALHLALIWVLMGASIAAILRRGALRRSMET